MMSPSPSALGTFSRRLPTDVPVSWASTGFGRADHIMPQPLWPLRQAPASARKILGSLGAGRMVKVYARDTKLGRTSR
jgi:hypothetical protein